jgi:hypothetical protein
MDSKQLQQFCSKDRDDERMNTPFSVGEFSYATNGHILVRVPRLADVPERDDALNLDRVSPSFNAEISIWLPVPFIAPLAYISCEVCGTSGRAYKCPECDGEGSVDLDTKFNTYDSVDCKTCEGNRQISRSEIDSLNNYYGDIEIIEETCDSCCGEGKFYKDQSIPVGEALFSDKYLHWIGQLDGCEIGVVDDVKPARFRFDGG